MNNEYFLEDSTFLINDKVLASICAVCGCLVGSQELHILWHNPNYYNRPDSELSAGQIREKARIELRLIKGLKV